MTSCFFISEEEHRKARESPTLTLAHTKSCFVAPFPPSLLRMSRRTGVIGVPQGHVSAAEIPHHQGRIRPGSGRPEAAWTRRQLQQIRAQVPVWRPGAEDGSGGTGSPRTRSQRPQAGAAADAEPGSRSPPAAAAPLDPGGIPGPAEQPVTDGAERRLWPPARRRADSESQPRRRHIPANPAVAEAPRGHAGASLWQECQQFSAAAHERSREAR